MAQAYFDPPLCIQEGDKQAINLSETPFFCNIDGRPRYAKTLASGVQLVEAARSDPNVSLGNSYKVLTATTTSPDPEYGDQTRLEFQASTVEYLPLWATRSNAAAFGMTLIEQGQGVMVHSEQPQLMHIDFEYGMFAGHRSPYMGTGYRLLGVVCTDLEHHDFPHVFASVDPHLPLVISVARYWPDLQKICVADLWLPSGQAIYVPPRPQLLGQQCLDLHGNRSSALACWRAHGQSSLQTQTLLQTQKSFVHWFWNDLPSIHPLLT